MLRFLFLLGVVIIISCEQTEVQQINKEASEATSASEEQKIALVIHGGAGTILKSKMSDEKEVAYRSFLDSLISQGYHLLEDGTNAQDVVIELISKMEESPLFNAGKGAVLTAEGNAELDASIMHGGSLNAGAVTQIKTVKSPIQLAALVMDKSNHVMLAGNGAEKFAADNNLERVSNDYFKTEERINQLKQIQAKNKDTTALASNYSTAIQDYKFGTVGCVALDKEGNIVAGTSTGGMMNKMWGRIGDSPIIGAGTYANNATCGISSTGWGEYFIRGVIAYDISAMMEYAAMSLADASNKVIHEKLNQLGGDGGVIGLDKEGNIIMEFNTAGMFRAGIDGNQQKTVALFGKD